LVTSTADGGIGTLRQAILDANANPGSDVIAFNLTGRGTQVISPLTALPTITEAVLIDGYSQSGSSANTLTLGDNAQLNVVLNGGQAASASGLVVQADGCTIRGLVLQRFSQFGIVFSGNNNVLAGCFVGTDSTGTTTQGFGNGNVGVLVTDNSSGNVIGGSTPAARNLISGNFNKGIALVGPNDQNNQVIGNYLGTDRSGTLAPGGQNVGLFIESQAHNNLVAANLISGMADGVALTSGSGLAAYANTVQGNLIGTDPTGTMPLGNGTGIVIDTGSHDNSVAGNVISANGTGVFLSGFGTDGNIISANRIGTDQSGLAPLGNSSDGIVLTLGAANNLIGGATLAAGNVISANGVAGVAVGRTGSPAGTNNVIAGNFIGTDVNGTVALGNGFEGVLINDGSAGTLVGGPGQGNVISGNGGAGVGIVNASNNTVQGNVIGLTADGKAPLGNQQGVGISFAFLTTNGNLIGGTAAGAGNVISGNASQGVSLNGPVTGNTVAGNWIGTNVLGANLGNGDSGVRLGDQASGNVIGGVGAGNVIAFNAKGVVLAGFGIFGDSILSNSIYANVGPGIDLNDDGPTPNGSETQGENNSQPYPILSAAGGTLVRGTLNAAPNTSYRLEFFASGVPGPAFQGQTFLGFLTITTDATGFAAFSAAVAPIPSGAAVTATATNLVTGDTSEFSTCPPAVVAVLAGSGQTANLNGTFAVPLQALVLDPYGSPVAGVSVTFAAPPGGLFGSFGGDASVTVMTDYLGVATAPDFTASTVAGTFAVTASVEGIALPASFVLTTLPGAAVGLAFLAVPTAPAAGTALSFKVGALDAFGNLANGYSANLTLSSNDPAAILPPSVAVVNGSGTFSVLFPSSGVKALTVTDPLHPNFTVTLSALQVTAVIFPTGLLIIPLLNVQTSGPVAHFTANYPATVSEFSALIDWGDGTKTAGTIQANSTGGFDVFGNHTYARETTFLVDVTIADPSRNTRETTAPSAAAVLTAGQGAQLQGVGFQRSAPGASSASASEPGVTATLSEPGGGSQTLTLFVATYSANPEPGAVEGLAFHDVRVTGVDGAGQLTVTFHYSGGKGQPVMLEFFDPDTNQYRSVVGSRLAPQSVTFDLVAETVTIVFDATSFPALTALGGTVFTIALAVPTSTGETISPAVAIAATSNTGLSSGLAQPAVFQTGTQLTLTLTPTQDGSLSANVANLDGGTDEPEPDANRAALDRLLSQIFSNLPGLLKPLLNLEELQRLLSESQAGVETVPTPIPTPSKGEQSRLPLLDSLFGEDWSEGLTADQRSEGFAGARGEGDRAALLMGLSLAIPAANDLREKGYRRSRRRWAQ
jgi:hypothetical protein